MRTEFIESHVKRSNRNLLLIGIVLTIVGAGLAAVSWVPALIAVPGVVAIACWLMRVVNPKRHPIYKRLSRYGDPGQLAAQLNQEFATADTAQPTHFGENWLAQADTYGLSLVPWSEIAWLHIYTKTQGGVRTSAYVRVWSRSGEQFVAPAGVRPGEAEELFEQLCTRAPWAEAGYSAELDHQWKKQRADFLARVEARRKRHSINLSRTAASGYLQN